ncbi:MAG: acetate--CoA ligase [Rhodobiaceae bacterium]|nr:acetate--CoA ligase [Rhodobiaceae bacterium]|tara:strand:+ start:2681 stop:4621 length:1941 start_codon:yes stop_codon:yes gene_type:complete
MTADKIFPVPENYKNSAHVTKEVYEDLCQQAEADSEKFWYKIGKRVDWIKPYSKVKDVTWSRKNVDINWYYDGKLNVSENCIDRHLKDKSDEIAIIWEGDNPDESLKISYRELHKKVCNLSNALKNNGVKKGDRITIYMPMIPEAAYSMLACSRIGAIHSVVFGGFSPEALAGRILDCNSHYVITADEGIRGGKTIPLKLNTDKALLKCPNVKNVFVVNRNNANIKMIEGRDLWYHDIIKNVSDECEAEVMDAEDPLFILYTSGSTGKPKGVLHTSGGYIVYASYTHEMIFDYKPGDIYWCSADVGWVTGHSYIIYGPLCNGATTLMFEGVPNFPDASRFWQICDKHKVNIFYTAPTAIRALMKEGDEPVKATKRDSLKLLGSVGEPINPEAWLWYYNIVGEKKCPIVDTWWQTETGATLISPLPGATDLKPGSASKPIPGINPVLLNTNGNELEGSNEGNLCIKSSWPGQMRTVYGDHDRFIETYFSQYDGYYFTGDGCRRDEDGYYWITGRVDDVINVSGHRMGTAEVESALVSHNKVAEAAVVGFPHEIKGQGIYAFVTLIAGEKMSDEIKKDLIGWVRREIGPIASPDFIQFSSNLPKTRSGKIMRRILRKIAANDYDDLGDTSTLAEPKVVDDLIKNKQNF